jgi:hypothetical protein
VKLLELQAKLKTIEKGKMALKKDLQEGKQER